MRRMMFAAAIAASVSACTVDDIDTVATSEQHAEAQNRLASNRLASNRLASNRLASNRLASNAISATTLLANLEDAQILENAEGRDVYSYLISCALPFDQSVVADLNYLGASAPADTNCDAPGTNGENCPNYSCTGGVCTFGGNLGLAPRWIDHRLDTTGRGWVSSCIFSRVNANEVAEAISIRGEHASVAVSEDEAGEFSLQEGAFYGNLFIDDPDASMPPDWNACRGSDKASTPTAGGLGNRKCAEENPLTPGYTYCGFKYAGDCRDYTPAVPTPYACRTADSVTAGAVGYTIYDDCYNRAGAGHWSGSKRSRQVLTVYVSNI